METPTMRTNRRVGATIALTLFFSTIVCGWIMILTRDVYYLIPSLGFMLTWMAASIANGGREVGEARLLGILQGQEEQID